jgi:hypothetical protein
MTCAVKKILTDLFASDNYPLDAMATGIWGKFWTGAVHLH